MGVLMKNSGFTFLELVVVVAIIGILASISATSYIKYRNKNEEHQVQQILITHMLRNTNKLFDSEYVSMTALPAYDSEFTPYAGILPRYGFANNGVSNIESNTYVIWSIMGRRVSNNDNYSFLINSRGWGCKVKETIPSESTCLSNGMEW